MEISLSGEAKQNHALVVGTYYLQENMSVKKPYWIGQTGMVAIWWDHNCWKIGLAEHLTSQYADIIGPSNNGDSPHQITDGWRCLNGTEYVGTNDIEFVDVTFKQSKFVFLVFKRL